MKSLPSAEIPGFVVNMKPSNIYARLDPTFESIRIETPVSSAYPVSHFVIRRGFEWRNAAQTNVGEVKLIVLSGVKSIFICIRKKKKWLQCLKFVSTKFFNIQEALLS